MLTISKNASGQFVLYLAALFSGISSVVSGIVLFRVFIASSGIDKTIPNQVFFVVGIIFQLVLAILLLAIVSLLSLRYKRLPNVREVISDIRKFDTTTHVYAIVSALVAGISILIIVLPSYEKFGTLAASVMYVLVPALSNGIADFVWNTKRKDKPVFGLLLLISFLALFVMASKSVIDLSSFESFLNGISGNVELMLYLGLAFGIFVMIGDQTLQRGIRYAKSLAGVQRSANSFVLVRIFWLAVLGLLLGLAETIAHGGLTQFIDVLKDATENRLSDLLFFVILVQAVGAIVNFIKGSLLGPYEKTPAEVTIGVGVSGLVTFILSAFLITNTVGFLKETSVDMSLLPQKIIATGVIIVLVYAFSKLKGNGARNN